MRTQRRSDGTFTLDGKRFEVPSRFRHIERLTLRYARWDLSTVDLIDPRSGTRLSALYPLDKTANANGQRRAVTHASTAPSATDATPATTIAPLLSKLMADYAATGLPPAYLPHTPTDDQDDQGSAP